MQNLVIYKRKRYRNFGLMLGFITLGIGIIGLIEFKSGGYQFNFGLCFIYYGIGVYTFFKPIIRTKNNILWTSAYPFRKINLNEIEKVKQFLDETTIVHKGKEILITNQQMSDEDKERFQLFIEQIQTNLQTRTTAQTI